MLTVAAGIRTRLLVGGARMAPRSMLVRGGGGAVPMQALAQAQQRQVWRREFWWGGDKDKEKERREKDAAAAEEGDDAAAATGAAAATADGNGGGDSASSSGNDSAHDGGGVDSGNGGGNNNSEGGNGDSNGGNEWDEDDGKSVTPYGTFPRVPHLLALPTWKGIIPVGMGPIVRVTNPETIQRITSDREAGRGFVATFMTKEEHSDADLPEMITDIDSVHQVGTFCAVHDLARRPSGEANILLLPVRRVAITGVRDNGPPMIVNVQHLSTPPYDRHNDRVQAYVRQIIATLRDVTSRNPLLREQLQSMNIAMNTDVTDPMKVADFCVALCTSALPEQMQQYLETESPLMRLQMTLELLTRELELAKIQEDIKEQVNEKINQGQREFFMREQLKYIRKELGMEKDDKESLVEKFNERVEEIKDLCHKETYEAMQQEVNKLSTLETGSPEYGVTRDYLQWLTSMPYGKTSEENFDIRRAKEVLDEDHYGLKDVKERILEFIAVGKLRQSVQGKIVCLIGPPGVGKTSVGTSIARALQREFYRFSVGGLTDVAEIKGHRRTYIGAMPGKIIQCLKTVQSENPLVLIDEIDKMGSSFRGDPASALLEMLDPAQNENFRDHYMDVPIDLSKVLFVCTANQEDTIPGPLRDRMEIIRLSGYDLPEKKEIAKRYLLPKHFEATGLGALGQQVGISDDALDSLIRWYCREAGVRNLEKHVEKICRKVAYYVASHNAEMETDAPEGFLDDMEVKAEHLNAFVGLPHFSHERLYETDQLPRGVVSGLAWTAMGGSMFYIESVGVAREQGKGGGFTLTGQMGDVMKESATIAMTYCQNFLQQHGIEHSNFFDNHTLHLHIPEGAVPKDGPSGGITMVTSLLSLAMKKRVPSNLAMTGEITLKGKVLKIGGLKEKIIAARRAGISRVIMPIENSRDYDELPDYLKEDLEVHFAANYEDVYNVVFAPNADLHTPNDDDDVATNHADSETLNRAPDTYITTS